MIIVNIITMYHISFLISLLPRFILSTYSTPSIHYQMNPSLIFLGYDIFTSFFIVFILLLFYIIFFHISNTYSIYIIIYYLSYL
jgi:hypothetical protein